MANKQFKVFCKDLDEIISIRSFDHANESKLYDHFKTYISKTPTSYSVKKYKKKLVDTLLLDASSYYVCDDLAITTDGDCHERKHRSTIQWSFVP